MGEMAIPKYYEFQKPILKLLSDAKEHSNKEIRSEMIKQFHLSGGDIALTLTSGQPILFNRIGWAKTYLKKAELIKSTARGVFMITDEGQKALQTAPAIITSKFLKQYKPFNDFINCTTQNGIKQTSIDDFNGDSPMDSMDQA